MNFSLQIRTLILYIFFKFNFPQIDKNFLKLHQMIYAQELQENITLKDIANERLNYYESQGWDTSALRNDIAKEEMILNIMDIKMDAKR